jgi:hypothetical protein
VSPQLNPTPTINITITPHTMAMAAAGSKSNQPSYLELLLHHKHINEGSLLCIHNFSGFHWHRQPRIFVTISLLSHAMPIINAGGVNAAADTTKSTSSKILPIESTADQRTPHTIQTSIQKP